MPPLSGASPGDMFLSIKGQKSGIIKGESKDTKHANEIDVLTWSWGMQGKPTFGGGAATGKATIHELKIVKHIDCASTALMAALRTNELIKQAVLVVRKAGSSPLEYLKITIENGRVTSLNLDASEGAAGPQIVENVSFTFNKISVEYTQQLKDGQGGAGFMFADQWDEPNKYGDVET